ncbi:MAG: hypothetical protein ACM3JE_00010 [Betaproteobacteria bacterium]
MPRLGKILGFLKALEARGYSLCYESGTCILGETETDSTNINQKYTTIKAMARTALI